MIGCVDSRVPIELIFDQGLGDLVVVRSAGEALDHSVIGSLEFGVAELHTPLLMVLGHQRCGALDATIKALDASHRTAEAGEIGYLVDTLAPAVRQVAGKPGDRLTNAVHANVDLVLGQTPPVHRSSARWRSQASSNSSAPTTNSTPARSIVRLDGGRAELGAEGWPAHSTQRSWGQARSRVKRR